MLLDVMKNIAEERNVPATQVAINWTSQQQGVTKMLAGGKNPKQSKMNADARNWS